MKKSCASYKLNLKEKMIKCRLPLRKMVENKCFIKKIDSFIRSRIQRLLTNIKRRGVYCLNTETGTQNRKKTIDFIYEKCILNLFFSAKLIFIISTFK